MADHTMTVHRSKFTKFSLFHVVRDSVSPAVEGCSNALKDWNMQPWNIIT